MKKSFLMTLAVLLLLAPAAGQARKVKLSNDIAWVMSAETYKCCVQQAYVNGMKRLEELIEGEVPGTWCVVLDADETIISNVLFQAELEAAGASYSREAWDAWCLRRAATLLPGAREFCLLVHRLGGKVIIVTNRQGHLKKATLENLNALGVPYDAGLFREGPYTDDRSKQARRRDVEKGTVKTLPPEVKLPPLTILMLAGDQEADLYDESLTFEAVKSRFGKDLIMIPNPMYGAWLPYDGFFFDTDKTEIKSKP